MTATTFHLAQVADALQRFTGTDLTSTLARLESAVKNRTVEDCPAFLAQQEIGCDLLSAAAVMKRLAGQINVTIHALGILLCLPHILEDGEVVKYVSLGAGNTGRDFDLETNRRVAEFKFINWRGGAETIRQNSIFKDFFLLAEAETTKRKYLYLLETERPLKFLRGGRAMRSVLSKNVALQQQFETRYGTRYQRVRDYFADHGHKVTVTDISRWVPELVGAMSEVGMDNDI